MSFRIEKDTMGEVKGPQINYGVPKQSVQETTLKLAPLPQCRLRWFTVLLI